MTKPIDQHRARFFNQYVQPLEEQHARIIARLKKGTATYNDFSNFNEYLRQEEALGLTMMYLLVCKYTPADNPLFEMAENLLAQNLIRLFTRCDSERVGDLGQFFLDFLDDPEKNAGIYAIVKKQQGILRRQAECFSEVESMIEEFQARGAAVLEQQRYEEQIADDEAELFDPFVPEELRDLRF